ncbi:MAG: PKD domain-containing protein [Bacteroidota bacterium]
MKHIITLLILLTLNTANILAQDNLYLINYGKGAELKEGDDDFSQSVYFKIPFNKTEKLYFWLFDADCGGELDHKSGAVFNTETKFTLAGGKGIVNKNIFEESFPVDSLIIFSAAIKDEIEYDNSWINLAELNPRFGFNDGGYSVFKFIVEGKSGDDGNIFDVKVTKDSLGLNSEEDVIIYSYSPTIHLSGITALGVAKFLIPDGTESINILNYDMDGAEYHFESAFRSNVPLTSSAEGKWETDVIQVNKLEVSRFASVNFGQVGSAANDVTFRITDKYYNSLPILLPPYLRKNNNRPVVKINISNLPDCFSYKFDASETSDPDNNKLSFHWQLSDGKSENASTFTHTFKEKKMYTGQLIVTDNSGEVNNSSVMEFSVKVNEKPQAIATARTSASPNEVITFDAARSRDLDGSIKTYNWDMGDGNKFDQAVIKHKYSRPGKYLAVLTLWDDSKSNCNFDTDTLNVWINSAPIANAGEHKKGAIDEVLSFDAGLSTDADGKIQNYVWNFDGVLKSGKVVNHSYKSPGKYKALLTVSDDANVSNSSSTSEVEILINEKPIAVAGKDVSLASGEKYKFDASGSKDYDGQISEYFWKFGDGSDGRGIIVEHEYTNPGKYTVELKIADDSKTSNSENYAYLTVTVNAQPKAVAGEDVHITLGEVKFDASKSTDVDGEIKEYKWNFGDGTFSTNMTTNHIYNRPGVYTVSLIVVDDSQTKNNTANDELIVTVNNPPFADAGPDVLSANDVKIMFDASNSFDSDGEIISYYWDFGDGSSADEKIVNHVYSIPGVYAVKLTVKDNTNQEYAFGSDETIVTINARPTAKVGKEIVASPNQVVKLDASASFDPDGSDLSYEWKFSDSEMIYRQKIVERNFVNPGIYTAELTVNDQSNAANSTAKDKLLIKINHQPAAKIGDDILTCNTVISLDGTKSTDADGDPLLYTWDLGSGKEKIKGAKIVHDFIKPGSYPVTLTVDDGTGVSNSSNSTYITVKINQAPTAVAGADVTACAGEIVNFDASKSSDPDGGVLKYLWNFGDGTSAEGINPLKSYSKGGSYTVSLRVEDNTGLTCNFDLDTRIVKVYESPKAAAGEDITTCANKEILFDGSKSTDNDGLVNSFTWDFGDGAMGGGATPTHAYRLPGTYNVVLTITGEQIGECDNSDTDELIVTVVDAPEASIASVDSTHANGSIHFDASNSLGKGFNIIAYNWDFGDGEKGTGGSISHIYKKNGKYIVTLSIKTDSKSECNVSAFSKPIFVNQAPIAKAGEDIFTGINSKVCFDGSGSYDTDGSITSFIWNFGDGETGSSVHDCHVYTQSGEYIVILEVKDNTHLANNKSYDTLNVKVNSTPFAEISAPDIVCGGETISIVGSKSRDNDGKIVSYKWDLGEGTVKEGETVTHIYKKAGAYEITLVVNDGTNVDNNSNSAVKKIKVNNPPVVNIASKNVIAINELITITPANTFDADDDKLNYNWFVNGSLKSNSEKFEYAFNSPGKQKVTLKVDDNTGVACSSREAEIFIDVNRSPVVELGEGRTIFIGKANDAALFTARSVNDPDNDQLFFTWDFGDGNKSFGRDVYYTYKTSGTYKVKLTVDDKKGASNSIVSDEIQVNVQDIR